MYFTNITYHMVPKYTKDNLVKDYLFSDSRDKKWFLTESQANTAVRKYLDKVPTAILNAFQKEDWHIIVTNENLEQKYGYNFEIYGVTDRDEKTIYIYSHQDALNYGLGHEIGHFLDEYLGFISDTEEWKRRKRSIASTFHHLCPSAIIVSYYTQSKKFSTRLF